MLNIICSTRLCVIGIVVHFSLIYSISKRCKALKKKSSTKRSLGKLKFWLQFSLNIPSFNSIEYPSFLISNQVFLLHFLTYYDDCIAKPLRIVTIITISGHIIKLPRSRKIQEKRLSENIFKWHRMRMELNTKKKHHQLCWE